jgi:hypothetical protein
VREFAQHRRPGQAGRVRKQPAGRFRGRDGGRAPAGGRVSIRSSAAGT